MRITTETFGNVLVVHAPEELTEEAASQFLDAFDTPIEAGQVNVVLEMDRSEAFDSTGLNTLLDLQDKLREQGGNLTVCGLGDPGRKIFEVTRLDKRFDIFDSIIDAVASFQ